MVLTWKYAALALRLKKLNSFEGEKHETKIVENVSSCCVILSLFWWNLKNEVLKPWFYEYSVKKRMFFIFQISSKYKKDRNSNLNHFQQLSFHTFPPPMMIFFFFLVLMPRIFKSTAITSNHILSHFATLTLILFNKQINKVIFYTIFTQFLKI